MTKLFKRTKKTKDVKFKSEFYLPKKETIKALSNRQPLTDEQVEDYITYIRNNYFVAKVNVGLLDQFCGEYTLFACDENRAQARLEKARKNVKEFLENGSVPDVVDALWISSNIYVDDVDTLRRRVITKVIVDDKLDLQVNIAKTNIATAKEVANLKGGLHELAMSVKSVEITF